MADVVKAIEEKKYGLAGFIMATGICVILGIAAFNWNTLQLIRSEVSPVLAEIQIGIAQNGEKIAENGMRIDQQHQSDMRNIYDAADTALSTKYKDLYGEELIAKAKESGQNFLAVKRAIGEPEILEQLRNKYPEQIATFVAYLGI